MLAFNHSDSKSVICDSLYYTRCSVADVREEFYRLTGEWCTEAQALVACYSVPDGAPAAMAAINVGPGALDDAQAKHYEAMRSGVRAITRYATRG